MKKCGKANKLYDMDVVNDYELSLKSQNSIDNR